MHKFDTLKFLKDHNIVHTQDHHHCSTGRVQIHCPFCSGKDNFHLGLWLSSGSGNCWRCGQHDVLKIIERLLRCDYRKALTIKKQYTTDEIEAVRKIREVKKPAESIELPYGTMKMKWEKGEGFWGWQYLEKRNFDPEKLIQEWDLKVTGYLGDYRFRIIAPIYYKNQLVSYQGRDITGKQDPRYKTCAKENEIVFHKDILYGLDKIPGDTVVVVEGITDVWRLGPGAAATFGIEWTMAQVNLLKNYKYVYIAYDNQPQAIRQALKLQAELSLFTEVNVIELNITWGRDPADLSQCAADEYMKRLKMHRTIASIRI